MIQLSREIRFSLGTQDEVGAITNSWAGWPSTNRVVPFLVATCVVQGTPDTQTGYVCNIKSIDDLLRSVVTDKLIPVFDGTQTYEHMLRLLFQQAEQAWADSPALVSISLAASPFLKFTLSADTPDMICLTQQFEFSASHRLHCDELSDEENKKTFGKCNNPNGHGHNYVVEVSVIGEHSDSKQVVDLSEFEAKVKSLVVDRLDHKNLNVDIDYFAKVIPSVENISIAIWNWLDGQLGGAKLERVRVYETPKTWADYSGG